MRMFLSIIFLLSIFNSASAEDCHPQRIISLGSSLTEELYLLGEEDKLVGVTVYCKNPPQAQNKEKVGTVVDVDLEKIVSLKPDLVLTTSLTNPKAKEKMRDLGIRTIDFPAVKDFSQLCEQFLKLAGLVGRESEAQGIVCRAQNKITFIKSVTKDLPRPDVFVQLGARPLYAATDEFFINDFIEFAGGRNIAKGAKNGIYSREKVVKDSPDVIIIVTMGIVGEKERETWRKFDTLKAVRNNKLYVIDSYRLCSPTPVTFVEVLEEIANILHPGKVKG